MFSTIVLYVGLIEISKVPSSSRLKLKQVLSVPFGSSIYSMVPSVYVIANLLPTVSVLTIPRPVSPFSPFEPSAPFSPGSPFSPFILPRDLEVPSLKDTVSVPSVSILTSLIPMPSLPSEPLVPTILPRSAVVLSE